MKIEMVEEEIEPTGESRQTEIAEPGFTPGPWSLTNEGTYIRPDCLKGTKPLIDPATDQECWPAICDVRPWPQDRWNCLGEAESRANARLMAAAPALYDAAKKAANELSVMLALTPARDGGLYREALDALNAALALVDGPQTKETT